jgi:hypothetical protein
MRKLIFPAIAAGTLMLGGCAAGLGGYGYGDPLSGILGSVLGGGLGGSGYANVNSRELQSAAVNACGEQASQYGQVSVDGVQQVSNSSLQVQGRVASNAYQQRSWACTFRADGRITDFRFG